MLVIMSASSREISRLRKKVVIQNQEILCGSLFMECVLNGQEILLVKSGVGAKKARSAARLIAAKYSPAVVLSVGAGGAVDPSLNIGDIVVARKIIHKTGSHHPCHDLLSRKAFELISKSGLPVTRGDCLTVDRFVHLKSEKKRVFHASGVKVIDMESSAAAQVMASANVPFCNVRVVSDTARNDALDVYGILRQKKISGAVGIYLYFFKSPSEILKAVKLLKDMTKVSEIILAVAKTMVGGLPFFDRQNSCKLNSAN